MKAKVSVIVPIHNSAQYLKKCVDSILAQTLQEIEIILVDDDSTDGGSVEVDAYAQHEPQIVALHRHCGGLGAAVNEGIAHAKAEYITIVNPSDWIEPEMCETLYEKGYINHADVVKCRHRIWDADADSGSVAASLCPFVYSEKLMDREAIFRSWRGEFSGWCGALYRTEFIHKGRIQFSDEANWGEDAYLEMCLLAEMRGCYMSRQCLYTRRETQSQRPMDSVFAEVLIKRYGRFWEWCQRSACSKQYFYTYELKNMYRDVVFCLRKIFRGGSKVGFIKTASALMKEIGKDADFADFSGGEKKDYLMIAHRPVWKLVKEALCYKHKTEAHSYTRLLGVRLTQTRRTETRETKYILWFPYKCTRTQGLKKRKYFVGIRYRTITMPVPPPQPLDLRLNVEGQGSQILAIAAYANAIHDLHRNTFPKYRCCHHGQDVVLIATGPTVNDAPPIREAKCLGVNRALTMERFKLDYFFICDWAAVREYSDVIVDYPCKKFFGITVTLRQDPYAVPNWITERAHAERYYRELNSPYAYQDISCFPLADHGSVTHAALNFLLYTHPRRIYLIGCDTSNNGYYDKKLVQPNVDLAYLRKGYEILRAMRDDYYPDVEIISVNPIGLRGLFRDMYTQSFLEKNTEIEVEKDDILNYIG